MSIFETYDNDDYETPVEELPGILAYTWDGEFFPIEKFMGPLEQLNDSDLSECLDDGDLPNKTIISVSGEKFCLTLDSWAVIESTLNALPAFTVLHDSGPPDAGQASGSGNLIFLSDGHSLAEAEDQINQLIFCIQPLIEKARMIQQSPSDSPSIAE